jgi:hypothetical protein
MSRPVAWSGVFRWPTWPGWRRGTAGSCARSRRTRGSATIRGCSGRPAAPPHRARPAAGLLYLPVASTAAYPLPVRQVLRSDSSLRRHPRPVRTTRAWSTPPARKCVCSVLGSRSWSAHRYMAIRLARSRALSPSRSMTWSEQTWWVARKRAKLSLCPAAIASGPTSDAPLGRVRRPLAVNTASRVARSRRLSSIALK